MRTVASHIHKVMGSQDESSAAADVSVAPEPAPAPQTPQAPIQGLTWQLFSCDGSDLSKCIALDSCASTDLFCRKDWLSNIGKSARPLTLSTNGGEVQVTEEGTLPGFGTVPVKEDAVANLFALASLAEKVSCYI